MSVERYDPAKGEAGFQRAVIELAETCGWLVYHVSNVKGRLVNRTALGFPDLCMVRRGYVVFAELKTDEGKRTEEQDRWATALSHVNWLCRTWAPEAKEVVQYYTWRPSSWPHIERVLTKGGANAEG